MTHWWRVKREVGQRIHESGWKFMFDGGNGVRMSFAFQVGVRFPFGSTTNGEQARSRLWGVVNA